MRSRSFITTTLFAVATVMTVATPASADPVAGAAIGAGVGAVAGHAVSGRDGALVGGALGAVAGYQIGKRHGQNRVRTVHYRERPIHQHHRTARAAYAPRAYYQPGSASYVVRPASYRAHRHVHYRHDRHGRLVRVVSWR